MSAIGNLRVSLIRSRDFAFGLLLAMVSASAVAVDEYPLTVTLAGAGTGAIVSTPSGITCANTGIPNSTCSAVFASGSTVTLSIAQISNGSSFAGWSGACTGMGSCAVTMDAAKSVTATFTDTDYTLAVTRAGAGFGTVTSSPAGIDCGSACTANFAKNSTVVLTAAPGASSTFGGWTGACLGLASTCTVSMDAARSVTATFDSGAPTTYPLSVTLAGAGTGAIVSTPSGITCANTGIPNSTCSAVFASGSTVTLSIAQISNGSSFAGWSGACTGMGSCAVTMDAAKSVTATFTDTDYTLTVTRAGAGLGAVTSSPAGISCGSTCTANFTKNSTVVLTAAPGASSTFGGWTGACLGLASTCTVSMDAARSVTATFDSGAPTTYPLTVTLAGAGTGAIVSTPSGITCANTGMPNSTCSAVFASGSTVTLSVALINTGSSFAGWSGACTGMGSCAVTMDATKSVVASFTSSTYEITAIANPTAGGSVSCSPNPVSHGGSSTCTATANAGYSFSAFSGDCSGATCVLGNVTSTRSVTATFTVITTPPAITGESPFVALGDLHTCALSTSGGVKCWGAANFLGEDTNVSRSKPEGFVPTLASGVKALTANQWHTCAITASGGVKCWGYNEYGGLGDGTLARSPIPVQVVGLESGVTSISAGRVHTCASTSTGAVKCWGSNIDGNMGDGTLINRLAPVNVVDLPESVAVASGDGHTCAITTAGAVFCWGDGGRLGDGTTFGRVRPVPVVGLSTGVKAVSSAHRHTCVISNNDGVACWGDNESGQLGDATNAARLTPVAVQGLLSGVSGLAVGRAHSCALTTGGGVKCWGNNDSGQLGDGTRNARNVPGNVIGLSSGVVSISAGLWHTCAIMVDGVMKCWGKSGIGALGSGNNTGIDQLEPVAVIGFTASTPDPVSGSALTVIKAGTGGGVVTSSPSGIDCGSTCAGVFPATTVVALTATPDSGSQFAGWGGVCSGTGSCSVTMDAAKSVTATFTKLGFALTVTKTGAGSGTVTSNPQGIDCGSTCLASFGSGTSVTLFANASAGSTFTGWSGACSGTATCSVTMDAAKAVIAGFDQGAGGLTRLFSDTWPAEIQELGGIAYDPVSDNLFFVKSTGRRSNSEVRRYNFQSGTIDVVHSFVGQWDYGARVANGELFVIGTYDDFLLRLGNLSASRLSEIAKYPVEVPGYEFSQVSDIAIANGNIYFVPGNYVAVPRYRGIRYLEGPGFSTMREVLSSEASGWPDPTTSNSRSIVVVGTGSSANLVVATGYSGNIELRDFSGRLLRSEAGYGYEHLEVDSVGRVYAVAQLTPSRRVITRWCQDLTGKQEFPLDISQASELSGEIRFVLRESANAVQLILTGYRARTNPVFYTAAVPKDATHCSSVTPPTSQLLSVTKSGTGTGVVSSSPSGILCGQSCSSGFAAGTTVVLTATAASGSSFTGWGGACTGVGACTVTMDAARNVTAAFSIVTVQDGIPEPFAFVDQTGVSPGAIVTSNEVTITGINIPVPVSVIGGSYSVNCSASFSTEVGVISNGQRVCVRQSAAAAPGVTTNTVLTVGGVSDTFSVTTSGSTTDTAAPKIISGPFVTSIGATSATVSWQTDEEGTSEASWGSGSLTFSAWRTSHVLILTGLSPKTPYVTVVQSKDRAGNISAPKYVLFTTAQSGDTVAPLIIDGPVAVGVSPSRALVKWRTNEPATTVVIGDATAAVGGLRTEHELELTALAPQTRYNVTVLSSDGSGNGPTTRTLSFITLATADLTPPVLTKGPLIADVGVDFATVAFETNEVASVRVSFESGGNFLVRAESRLETSHSVRVGGLAPNTVYSVTVAATDAFGNGPTLSAPLQVTTATGTDLVGPVFVEPVSLCQISADLLLLCFRTDEPASVNVEYGLQTGARDFTASRTSLLQSHSIALAGLASSSTYQFKVTVTDSAGNATTSAVGTATTLNASVSTNPRILSGPTVSYTGSDRVVVEWETDRPTTSLVEYGTTSLNLQVADGALKTTHSIVVSGLAAGTAYQFRVKSTDMSGLSVESSVSASATDLGKAPATFTTLSTVDATAPTITLAPVVTPISGQSVRVEWATNEVSNAVVQYGLAESALTILVGDIEYAKSHQITLTKLSATAPYFAQVKSTDPSGNVVISPTFTFKVTTPQAAPVLTVTLAGGGSGSVASSPVGISCGNDCSETYIAGTVVTLTATPASGSNFAGWSGLCSGTGTCTLTMDAAKSVTATFNSATSFDANVRSVVSGYYQTILGRAADQAGLDFWVGEIARVRGLGADVREVFFAMSMTFFASPEYAGRSTTDTQFINDLYRTFFGRSPDAGGLAYWQGELTAAGSRSALLNSFLFSAEFSNQMTTMFGPASVRPEITLVIDLFRGAFGRLPDSAGFNHWLGRIRTAQCQGAAAVNAEVNNIAGQFFSGGEYSVRARNDRDFVGDLYNAFLRRGPGGDSMGFNYWVGQVPQLGREVVRSQFVPSPEFQNRVIAVIGAGCLQ